MRYVKVLIIVLVLAGAMLFGIHNPEPYTLSFLSYRLVFDIPLWALLMLSFFAGMVPIIIVGLPEKTAYMKKMKELRLKRKEFEGSLKSVSVSNQS